MSMSASSAYKQALRSVMGSTVPLSRPRGLQCLEFDGVHTLQYDLNQPMVDFPARKLHRAFAVAEAYWIITGSDRVEHLTPYISDYGDRYSDDGDTLFGAYGPRFCSQLDHVVKKLLEDRSSRQAVISFWRANPPKSKDIPCTLSAVFSIRGGALDMHVSMRSSDAWMGLPYDMFSYGCMAAVVAAVYNGAIADPDQPENQITLGRGFITATNRHIYASDFDAVHNFLHDENCRTPVNPPTMPESWLTCDSGGPLIYRDLRNVLTTYQHNRAIALAGTGATKALVEAGAWWLSNRLINPEDAR